MRRLPKKVREYVYRRDGGKCRLCGRPVELKEAHVHHIYHRFGVIPADLDVPSNDHPDNLILLCPECHVRIHSGFEIPDNLRKALVMINKNRARLMRG